MGDDDRSKKELSDFTLGSATPKPDDAEPRVLATASLGRRAFFRRAAATAGAGVATSILGCDSGKPTEAQRSKSCTRTTCFSHSAAVRSLAFAPGGQMIATAGADGAIKLWNAKTGELLRTLSAHSGAVNSVTFSPDGTRLASGGDDGAARTWNAADGTALTHFAGHTGSVFGVAYFPDGARLASCGADGTVQIWDAATGAAGLTYRGHAPGAQVRCLAVSPDGTQIASGGTDDSARLWKAADGSSQRMQSHSHAVLSVAFFPDGKKIVSAESYVTGGVRIWDAATGLRLVSIDTSPSGWGTESVFIAVSPDGSRVAIADRDGSVALFGASNGARQVTCSAHQGLALGVAFSPAGDVLASAGDDKVAVVDNASTGASILALMDKTLTQTSTDQGRTACDRMGRAQSVACTCDEVCSCDLVCNCEAVCTCDSEGGYWYPN